jgi:hypothetical protein
MTNVKYTEQVNSGDMLLTTVSKVPYLNRGWNMGCAARCVCGFPHSVHVYVGLCVKIVRDKLLSTSFAIRNYPIISSGC